MKNRVLLFVALSCIYFSNAQTPISFYPSFDPLVPNFGSKVDLDGNEILVSNASGFVYLFEKNDNGLLQKELIEAPDASDGTFGYSISIHNNCIAVGDPLNNTVAVDAGLVYMYRKTAEDVYDLQQIIPAPETTTNYHFGSCVKVFGDKLFITAENKVNNMNASSNLGSVYYYVFNGTEWVFQQKITKENCIHFGKKIEINDYSLVLYSTNATSTIQSVNFYKIFNDSYFNASSFDFTGAENNFDFSLSENYVYVLYGNFVQPISINLEGIYLTTNLIEIPQMLYGDFIPGIIFANNNKFFIGFTGYTLQIVRKFFIMRFEKVDNNWYYYGTNSGAGPIEDDYFGSCIASKGNLVIIGAPGESLQPLTQGNAYYLDYALATEQFERNGFSLFPNPTSDRVFVKNIHSLAINKIEIYSVSGKLLQSQNTNFNEISLENFAKGLYFAKIYDQNEVSQSFKIVKN